MSTLCVLLVGVNIYRKIVGVEQQADFTYVVRTLQRHNWSFANTYEQIALTGKAWNDFVNTNGILNKEYDTIEDIYQPEFHKTLGHTIIDFFAKLVTGKSLKQAITGNTLFSGLNAIWQSMKVPFIIVSDVCTNMFNVISTVLTLLGVNTFHTE